MKTMSQVPSRRRTLGAGLTEAKLRRRWPRALLWIVGIALVADTVGFMAYVSRYQPLAAGPASGVDERQVVRELSVTSPAGQHFSQFRIDDVHGDRFWFGFTLENGGRLPVTIASVAAAPAGGTATLPDASVRLGQEDATGRFATLEATPFQSFTLEAAGRRAVIIDARIGRCRPDAGATYYGSVVVTYKVLGFFTRRTTVTLPYTIEVPADAACRPTGRDDALNEG